ncbi:MAG: hypothetical protein R3B99_31150 [Polyangiales bacterium]
MRCPRRATRPSRSGLGLALLFVVFTWVRRLRDPNERLALRASIPAYKWLIHAFLVAAVGLLVVSPLVVGASTVSSMDAAPTCTTSGSQTTPTF